MDLQTQLYPRTLFQFTLPDLAKHFQSLLGPRGDQVDTINSLLLGSIHKEALPVPIYDLWLNIAVCHSPRLLQVALYDPVSCGVRKAAIKAVARAFHSKNWKDAWDVLGGAAGLKDAMGNMPQEEVRLLSVAIAKCKNMPDLDDAAARVEELFRLFDETSNASTQRTLSFQLSPLLDLCSDAFIVNYLSRYPPNSRIVLHRLHSLASIRPGLLRKIAVGSVDFHLRGRVEVIREYTDALVRTRLPYIPVHLPIDGPSSNLPSRLAFCVDLIHAVFADPTLQSHLQSVLWHYINETLKTEVRRRCEFDHILEFCQRVLRYYNGRDELWKKEGEQLVESVLRYWSDAQTSSSTAAHRHRETRPSSKHTEALESLLIEIISQFPQQRLDVRRDRTAFDSRITRLLDEIHPSTRLPFIKLFLRYAKFLGIDLDVWPPSERERHLFPAWDLKLLRALTPADAKWLFDRSLAINDCDEFLPRSDDVNGNRILWPEQCVLKTRWESHDPNAHNFPFTLKVLDEIKKRAERETDRLTWANTAIRVAQASMSLDILHQVVEWTRRYLRDPFVFPTLIENLFENTSSVLSCTNFPLRRRPKSKTALSAAVSKANQIFMTYLEIIRLAVREPHYQRYMTNGIVSLFREVIEQRILKVKAYQKAGLASESELITITLDPLEPVILEYERLAIVEDPEKFIWSELGGLLDGLWCPERPSPRILSFLDRLARKRDELWCHGQPYNYSNLTKMPTGWPEGLPIQYLLPSAKWTYLSLTNPEAAPFVASRVQAILFAQADVILKPFHPDTEIYSPPDSLGFAIRSFLQCPAIKEKKSRIECIWNHYSNILSSYPEQLVVFRDWLTPIADGLWVPETQRHPVPLATYLSQCLGPSEVVEWDPHDGAIQSQDTKQTEQEIPMILLHYRMQAEVWSILRYKPLQKQKPIIERGPMWVWELDFGSRSAWPLQSNEVIILSAILFLDTLTKGKERILSQPFPQGGETSRYPSIYLDDQFVGPLEKCLDSAVRSATAALKASVRWIPSQILHDLITGLLDRLSVSSEKPANYSTLLKCTFDLMKLLPFTDRPGLMVDIALRILESFPDESSYHRHLKLHSLGKMLTAQDAGFMIQRFATFTCDALEKQKQNPVHHAGSPVEGDASSNPEKGRAFIKITTAKMLAQLLANAEFVPKSTCLCNLRRLFHSGRHIDVRTKVVDAILGLFDRESDQEETYQLFASLASYAAGPNERFDVSEQAWLAAEEGKQLLPEISPASQRPLFQLFVCTASSKLPEHYRADYAQRVVLGILDDWERQHSRWMKCFLCRIGLTPEEISMVNLGPFNPAAVDRVFCNWWRYLPARYLRLHRTWAMSYLNFPLFENINQKLSSQDRGWRETTAGQHWLDCLNQFRRSDCLSRPHFILADGSGTRVENGITINDAISEYLTRAAIMIRTPFRYDHRQNRVIISPEQIMAPLRRLRSDRNEVLPGKDSKTKYNRLQDIMQRVVADIESLRTDEWQRNPNRQPAVLPSRLELQTILLPSPTYNPASDKPLREFTNQVIPLIQSCADNPMLLTEFSYITSLSQLIPAQDIPSYVLMLGNDPVEEHTSLFGALKIELARNALERIKSEDRLLNADLVEMARKWKGSPNESVQRAGWMIDGSL